MLAPNSGSMTARRRLRTSSTDGGGTCRVEPGVVTPSTYRRHAAPADESVTVLVTEPLVDGSFEVTMITLTPAAATKVKQLLETENATDLALRVAVRPGGCSGYSYEMYFDGDFTSEDKVHTFGDVKVVVDPASAQLLAGASLDYADGLNESGFKITNPNANRTCGCGQSFS